MDDNRNKAMDHARRIRASVIRRHGYDSEEQVPGPDRASAIEDTASLATVSAHWGITSGSPLVGQVIVLAKRVLRIGLRWYINPIVEQQNAFNDAVLRALYELQAENDKIRADLAQITANQVEQ